MALDPVPLKSLGLSRNVLCGVVAVSGAGYDLTDEETYEIAQTEGLFEKLFHTGSIPESLRRQLSPVKFAVPGAPPFLILYSGDDMKELQHESQDLHNHLLEAGIKSQLLAIPHEGHKEIVVALSHPDKIPPAAILVFMQTLNCH